MFEGIFILILTLTTPSGAAVTTAEIYGKEACEVAAKQWKSDVEGMNKLRPNPYHAKTLCIKK